MKSLNANLVPPLCLHGSAAFVLVLCGLILASGCRNSDSGTHPSSVEDSASATKSDPVKTAEVVTDVPQSTDATLKAMGYTQSFLNRLVLKESVILAVAGFIPGSLLSLLLYSEASGATNLPIHMTMERALGGRGE